MACCAALSAFLPLCAEVVVLQRGSCACRIMVATDGKEGLLFCITGMLPACGLLQGLVYRRLVHHGGVWQYSLQDAHPPLRHQ